MLYGIIYYRGQNGEYGFIARRQKFDSAEEQKQLSPYILAILQEETGDIFLLEQKVLRYAKENGVTIVHDFSSSDVDEVAEISTEERIEMLESSVRALAAKLEAVQREKWELEYAAWCVNQQQDDVVRSEFLLGEASAIMKIARNQFGCKHIKRAAKSLYRNKQSLLH